MSYDSISTFMYLAIVPANLAKIEVAQIPSSVLKNTNFTSHLRMHYAKITSLKSIGDA